MNKAESCLLAEFLFGESLRGTGFNMREFESLLGGKDNLPIVEKAIRFFCKRVLLLQ